MHPGAAFVRQISQRNICPLADGSGGYSLGKHRPQVSAHLPEVAAIGKNPGQPKAIPGDAEKGEQIRQRRFRLQHQGFISQLSLPSSNARQRSAR